RNRRQHDMRARRGRRLADARLHHQVPRRLRGQDRGGARSGLMRLLILLAVLGLGVAAVPTTARAQVPAAQRVDLGPGGAPATPAHATHEHPKGRALFFWLSALIAVGGAILTITRRNAVMAVMCLVLSFLGLASLYTILYAHFLAVIQVLVYAGAIM